MRDCHVHLAINPYEDERIESSRSTTSYQLPTSYSLDSWTENMSNSMYLSSHSSNRHSTNPMIMPFHIGQENETYFRHEAKLQLDRILNECEPVVEINKSSSRWKQRRVRGKFHKNESPSMLQCWTRKSTRGTLETPYAVKTCTRIKAPIEILMQVLDCSEASTYRSFTKIIYDQLVADTAVLYHSKHSSHEATRLQRNTMTPRTATSSVATSLVSSGTHGSLHAYMDNLETSGENETLAVRWAVCRCQTHMMADCDFCLLEYSKMHTVDEMLAYQSLRDTMRMYPNNNQAFHDVYSNESNMENLPRQSRSGQNKTQLFRSRDVLPKAYKLMWSITTKWCPDLSETYRLVRSNIPLGGFLLYETDRTDETDVVFYMSVNRPTQHPLDRNVKSLLASHAERQFKAICKAVKQYACSISRLSNAVEAYEMNLRLQSMSRNQWIDDSLRTECVVCCRRFHLVTRRKHHCRLCGDVMCEQCSVYRDADVATIGPTKLRICKFCDEEPVSFNSYSTNHEDQSQDESPLYGNLSEKIDEEALPIEDRRNAQERPTTPPSSDHRSISNFIGSFFSGSIRSTSTRSLVESNQDDRHTISDSIPHRLSLSRPLRRASEFTNMRRQSRNADYFHNNKTKAPLRSTSNNISTEDSKPLHQNYRLHTPNMEKSAKRSKIDDSENDEHRAIKPKAVTFSDKHSIHKSAGSIRSANRPSPIDTKSGQARFQSPSQTKIPHGSAQFLNQPQLLRRKFWSNAQVQPLHTPNQKPLQPWKSYRSIFLQLCEELRNVLECRYAAVSLLIPSQDGTLPSIHFLNANGATRLLPVAEKVGCCRPVLQYKTPVAVNNTLETKTKYQLETLPIVRGPQQTKFYASVPLYLADTHEFIGAIAVFDNMPYNYGRSSIPEVPQDDTSTSGTSNFQRPEDLNAVISVMENMAKAAMTNVLNKQHLLLVTSLSSHPKGIIKANTTTFAKEPSPIKVTPPHYTIDENLQMDMDTTDHREEIDRNRFSSKWKSNANALHFTPKLSPVQKAIQFKENIAQRRNSGSPYKYMQDNIHEMNESPYKMNGIYGRHRRYYE